MSNPATNPVHYTYTSPNAPANTGSTKSSIPHPPSISTKVYTIAGIQSTVYGLAELPSSATNIAVLWLLHPRLQTQSCMAPFAAHFITTWNTTRHQNQTNKGLIAVSFDQRNHGTREVNPLANEAWRSKNETHAQDMFSCYAGTAQDTSLLIDYLPAYVFPEGDRRIVQNVVMGVSLGGHAAWHVVMHDSRVDAAIVTIGCPDYERLMSDRARLSKRKTWLEGKGAKFVGSKDYPWTLRDSVKKFDPAGLVFGTLGERKTEDLTADEKERVLPVLNKLFGNKRILNLSGGSDKLVPYAMGKPFLDFLRGVTGRGRLFDNGGLYFEDVVVPGAGHEVPPEMVQHMERFLMETLETGVESTEKKSRRHSHI